MHGEITAIRHCTDILRQRGWSPQRILQSWKDFSLYTNGEPCPMCASAIRWAGFKEVIYGSSIRTIAESKLDLTWLRKNRLHRRWKKSDLHPIYHDLGEELLAGPCDTDVGPDSKSQNSQQAWKRPYQRDRRVLFASVQRVSSMSYVTLYCCEG